MRQIINVETGEEILEEIDSKIIAERKAKLEADKLARSQAQAKRTALLEKLGITEEEAKLLLS